MAALTFVVLYGASADLRPLPPSYPGGYRRSVESAGRRPSRSICCNSFIFNVWVHIWCASTGKAYRFVAITLWKSEGGLDQMTDSFCW